MQIYLPIAEMPVDMFLIAAIGAAVGFLSGMFGVGGGFLMTPLLIFLGIPPAIAVATQAAQIAAASTTGTLAALRRDAVDMRLGLVLLGGGLLGTAIGVAIFNMLRRLGQLDIVIVVSYVTLFGVVGTLMLVESIKALTARRRGVQPLPPKPPWHRDLPWRMAFPRAGLEASLIPLVGIAMLIGIAGSVLGIGGGFIMVPVLIYMFRVPVALVVGTSQFQILFTMLGATVLHAATNQTVDIVLAMLLTVGGVFGAQFGARAGRNLKGEAFRLLLALLILAVGLRFAFELTATPQDRYTIAPVEVSG